MNRPNILLLMTDQQRGDCLGVDGHPVLQTPYLDQLAAEGVRFRHAYTACPVCVPARRTLMTGQTAFHHGVMMNHHTRLEGETLPGALAGAGYQTHLVGKLHLWPHRKLYGFCSADWSDAPGHDEDDYARWLRRNGIGHPDAGLSHGASQNGYVARPWHLEERFHFTNWCADMALEFLERRDPTLPFFLNVSFHQPHQPCCPPRDYYDRYLAMDLGEPVVGDWARVFDAPPRGLPVDAWRAAFPPAVLQQYRAGYYGCINHIDDQVGRILRHIPHNTIVVFVSDHGEMLGDHQWIRKRSAFEPSARIPMLWRFPSGLGRGQVRDEPVELMDVMPTLLGAAGVPVPGSVDGRDLAVLLSGACRDWREWLHGECAQVPTLGSGMQYLTDGRRKFIWYPGTGEEQFFDLEADPSELCNLAGDASRHDEIAVWRQRLVEQLAGRPESFTDGRRLTPIGGDSPFFRPGFERPS